MLRKWKSQDSLNISEVLVVVHQNYTYERLLAINLLTKVAFEHNWEIW